MVYFFAGFCRKVLCESKIKNFIFSGHDKIVQTDLMLSGPVESWSSFKFADFKAYRMTQNSDIKSLLLATSDLLLIVAGQYHIIKGLFIW